MAGIASAGLARRAGGNLGQASPDVLRAMVQAFAGALAGAGADTLCGAPYGQVSEDRVDYRNGCRQRRRDPRAGTTGLAVPGLGQGSYFPERLPGRRRRAGQALISVAAACCLPGAGTRRAETPGITSLSKSQAGGLAKTPDAAAGQFRSRPATPGRTGSCRPAR